MKSISRIKITQELVDDLYDCKIRNQQYKLMDSKSSSRLRSYRNLIGGTTKGDLVIDIINKVAKTYDEAMYFQKYFIETDLRCTKLKFKRENLIEDIRKILNLDLPLSEQYIVANEILKKKNDLVKLIK